MKRLATFIAPLTLAVLLVAAAAPLAAFARTWTNQSSYSPGSVVTISGDNSDGAGYLAGETAHIAAGISGSYSVSCDAVADATGAWSCQLVLPSGDAPIGTSSYTATGQSSGVSQFGTFRDSGCPDVNATGNGQQLQSNLVGASFSVSGNTATYVFNSLVDLSPSGGVPGLIEYCVYPANPPGNPDSATAQAIGADGEAFTADRTGNGFFDFERKTGNPSNIPLNGTSGTVMGTAAWNAGAPSSQSIILHINDTAECSRLYGSGTNTCFVLPGKPQAQLTLIKKVDHNGTSDNTAATAWTLTASLNGSAVLSGTSGITGTLSPGTYALAESGPGAPGWTSSGYDCGSSVTLAAGDNKTCTVTNTAVPPKLTMVKKVDHSGTSDTSAATAWILSATSGTSVISGAGGVTSATADIGSYALAESGPGAPGWTSSGFDCGAGAVTSVTLALGDNKTCTITNTAVPPTLTLVKVIDHNGTGDNTLATTWTLTAKNSMALLNPTISGAGGASNTADIGTYSLSESGPAAPGWTTSGYDCGTSVTLALGDNKTCTITNKAVPPKITIVKKATGRPGGGDTFSFAVNGPSASTRSVTTNTQISGTTYRSDVTFTTQIGSYTISENANGTWVLTGAVCYSGSEQTLVPAGAVNELPPSPTTFSLSLGGRETCVFENMLPVTRTQGFWATHYNFTNSMWATKVPAADQQIVCGTTVVKNITNVLGTATSNLYGGFWAGISKTTAGKSRTSLDQARMKLVQQLQAAILNHDVFGAPDNGLIAQAKADYCGTNANAITSDAGALGQYNQSGEVVPLDPSQFALTPAEPQQAQTAANKKYWDTLP